MVNQLTYGPSPKRALVRVRLSGERTVVRTFPTEPVLDRSSWSPDGKALVFTANVRNRTVSGSSEGNDLYVTRIDGQRVRRLTRLKAASDPLWTPDGRSIVFSLTRRNPSGVVSRHLMRIGTDGNDLREMTAPTPNQADQAGSFSADGTRLAFTRWRVAAGTQRSSPASPASIRLLELSNGREQILVRRGQDPAFSPDGDRLAFVSDRRSSGRTGVGHAETLGNDLYIAKADGSGIRRSTRSRDRNERYPAWSPDGRRLAYQRGQRTGNAESAVVMLTDPLGNCHRTLLADPDLSPSFTGPVWHPTRTVRSMKCHRPRAG